MGELSYSSPTHPSSELKDIVSLDVGLNITIKKLPVHRIGIKGGEENEGNKDSADFPI